MSCPPPAGSAAGPEVVAAELEVVSRRALWMGPVFAVLAVLLIPWTVYLAVTLPHQQTARRYDLAWAGFDVGLAGALAWTAWTALRGSRWLVIAASFCAALLVVDAWFDAVTSPSRHDLVLALASAVVIELPLAGVCLWMAINGQRIIERRITLRLLRRGGPYRGRK